MKFQELIGVEFNAGCGVDTAYYKDAWKGVSPLCEIVCVDFTETPPIAAQAQTGAVAANDNQRGLFDAAA